MPMTAQVTVNDRVYSNPRRSAVVSVSMAANPNIWTSRSRKAECRRCNECTAKAPTGLRIRSCPPSRTLTAFQSQQAVRRRLTESAETHDSELSVIYARDILDEWLGTDVAHVVLPIMDPYVAHHGALGSFATSYLPEGAGRKAIRTRPAALSGMTEPTTNEAAAGEFELPGDRIGDVVLISDGTTAISTSADRQDLSALSEPLRSHGGLTEQAVHFIVNRRIDLPNAPELRNFGAFFHSTAAATID